MKINDNIYEVIKLLCDSLQRCLEEAEGYLDESHGCKPEDVMDYDGWAHKAKDLLRNYNCANFSEIASASSTLSARPAMPITDKAPIIPEKVSTSSISSGE